MDQICRQKYPGMRFQLADARVLDQFNDIAFAFFSFNGNDYVMQLYRPRVLNAIRRALGDNEGSVFSSHNTALHKTRLNWRLLRVLARLRGLVGACLPRGSRSSEDEGVEYQYKVKKLSSIGLSLGMYDIAARGELIQLAWRGFRCDHWHERVSRDRSR